MMSCFRILIFILLAALPMWSVARGLDDSLRVRYIAHDTDMWTCGQLIFFSCREPVMLDAHGRVSSGVLGANSMILCVDNRFREFARDCRVTLDSLGLLVSGTPAVGLEVAVQEQTVYSMPYTEVSFFPNGRVRYITPSDNFRFTAADGFKFAVMGGRRAYFDEHGRLVSAIVARRRIHQLPDGSQRVYLPGDSIELDAEGRVQ